MIKKTVIFILILVPSFLFAPECITTDEFIIEKKVAICSEKDSDVSGVALAKTEKKYSQLHAELLEEYERLLRCHAECLRKIADAQEKCIDVFKKTIEDTPKMTRERVKKEHARVKKLCESLDAVNFY